MYCMLHYDRERGLCRCKWPVLRCKSLIVLLEIDRTGDTKRATTMGYLGAAGLALTFSLSAILDTQFSLRLGRLQLHVRSSIVPAVYRCGRRYCTTAPRPSYARVISLPSVFIVDRYVSRGRHIGGTTDRTKQTTTVNKRISFVALQMRRA